MRGQHCEVSAMKASAAWLCSFLNTATVPAIMWLEDNYNCNIETEEVGYGALSFEHSTVTSNYAIDGDEETNLKRALTEIYPNDNFSYLTDSYDHDNFLLNVVPACKDEILAHNGTILFRGDSGDPVEIIAGKKIEAVLFDEDELADLEDYFKDYAYDNDIDGEDTCYFNINGTFYKVFFQPEYTNERGAWTDTKYWFIEDYNIKYEEIEPSLELLGMVWYLDQIFGSTLNSKAYKVLNPHVKAIYGDSMTPSRVREAYERLTAQGYAINNVVFGVGSFSFMGIETIDEDGNVSYGPYTRDTFGYAIKATYGEDADGNPVMIYKQPKALAWKKSPKGCIIVAPDGQSYTDGHTFEEAHGEGVENLLELVFKDGKMVKETSLKEIRERMYGGKF
jgi:nicotinamide phosphoribosyltransferase